LVPRVIGADVLPLQVSVNESVPSKSRSEKVWTSLIGAASDDVYAVISS
jgi:hypothetical protein